MYTSNTSNHNSMMISNKKTLINKKTRRFFDVSIITIWFLVVNVAVASASILQRTHVTLNACDLDCQNNGYCVRLSKNDMTDDNEEGKENLKPPEICACSKEYKGSLCDMESDCKVAKQVSQLAEKMCLNPKTVYCDHGIDDAISINSYCTNGGACRDYRLPDDVRTKCDCPEEFGGQHCEFFLAALEIREDPGTAQPSDDKTTTTEFTYKTIILLLIPAAAIFGLFSIYVVKLFLNYKQRKYQDTMMQIMEDLNIDTDDIGVCDGDIGTARTRQNRKPPTDVIIEMNIQSQRHLVRNQPDLQFNIDDDFDNENVKKVSTNISKIQQEPKKEYSLANIEFASMS